MFILSTDVINTVYGFALVSALVYFVYQFHVTRHIYINAVRYVPLWCLLIFGFLYAVFDSTFLYQDILRFAVTPVLAYLAGWVLCENSKDKFSLIRYIVYVVAVGKGLHALLNIPINVDNLRWLQTDFFTGEVISATEYGALNTIIFSTASYWLIAEKKVLVKIFGIALFIISLLYGFELGSRTQFLILAVCFVICTLVYLIQKNNLKTAFRFLIGVLIAIVIYTIMYNNDTFGIRTLIESSNLADRIKSANSGSLTRADDYRIDSLTNGLDSLLSHPLGGLRDVEYFHNTWLDIGRISGVVPFIAWLVFTVSSFKHVLFFVRKKFTSIEMGILLLSLFLGLYINMFVEPAMEGMIWMVYTFVWISGMIDSTYYTDTDLTNAGV